VIGGVTVTCAQAASALDALERSGGVMIRQVLAAVSSPLAGCDYLSALEPFKAPPPAARNGYGRGAAGRPAARQAFIRAIRAALDGAAAAEPARHFAAELTSARDAFGSDAGYATAMARAAVAVRERAHAARLRALLSGQVAAAVSQCAARRGEFACAAVAACGTGDCALAGAALAGPAMTVPAGPGRVPRPANHVRGGAFGTAAALAALAAAVPFDVRAAHCETAAAAVRVSGGDCACARDCVPCGPR